MGKDYVRKSVHLSPPDRPRWYSQDGRETSLVYLAWGERFFDRHPVPVYLHDAWSYTVILKGKPTLMIGQERHPLQAGEGVLVGPDCPMGWTAEKTGAGTTLLGWTWRRDPFFLGEDSRASWFRMRMSPARVQRLTGLHSRCREEVESSDGAGLAALDALRVLVDTEFCRAMNHRKSLTQASLRFQLAVRWMESHLTLAHPVELLCEYLQVGPATLRELFQERVHMSPLAYFQRLRFSQAEQLLKDKNNSVKAVALSLGYRHPNHFSRAFARYAGYLPRRLRDE